MLKSMYSGISGMKANQTKLDVIGNNISNVGTTSYKSSRAKFSDMLYQNVKASMSPTTTKGGVNAQQVGLGVQLSSIDRVMTQGMMQPTSRALDVAIDGDGFFMVSKGPSVLGDDTLSVTHTTGTHTVTDQSLSTSGSQLFYTRDGGFTLDESGNLLTTNGYRVLGYALTNGDNSAKATAISPTGINLSSMDFRFGPGSQLNGYKIAFGDIGPGTVASATVDEANKRIVISGDFSSDTSLTTAQVESAANKALSAAGISQRLNVSGNVTKIKELSTDSITGGADATAPDSISFLGVTFKFDKGNELNGYSFRIASIATGDEVPTVDIDGKEIVIHADLSKVSAKGIMDAVNAQLNTEGISQGISSATGSISLVSGSKATTSGGTDTVGAKATIKGMNITFPAGEGYNDYNIVINELDAAGAATASIDGKTITLNGKFSSPVPADLATQIQTAIQGLPGLNGVSVTGNATAVTGLSSTTIDGGYKNTAPNSQTAFNMNFEFSEGAALNGYKIKIGTITQGTPVSSVVDTKSKTITINGDFTTANAVTANRVETAIRSALRDKGLTSQEIAVSGEPRYLAEGISADEILGGTPVQSINESGAISFVDATKNLKAYDGSLKTLKIPETVVVEGTGQELKVKSYTIDTTGVISAILEDGSVSALGQIAMASFKNPEGLASLGGNLYGSSANSGEATVKSGLGTTGEDNSKGYGDNLQGMLEMSNVDLAEQFTDMIVTNRAFQASGKMITTGDEILQDIINLKR